MFGVLKISFKASYNDSMGKDNTENKIFPLKVSQHIQIFQKNVSVVPKFSPWCYLNSINTTDSNTREK